MSQKAWGGRFSEATDARVERFTESISFDARLAPYDIRGSQAHATMLAEVGLLAPQERDEICRTLDEIGQEIARGEFVFRIELEDIHMHIERALIERTGDVGRKLHTGRSRNDQVATDVKLFLRDAHDHVCELLENLQRSFVERAPRDLDVVLPAYTHLQRAQPVMAVHYWLAWCEKFERDRSRLMDGRRRANVSPLGCAALAGSSLPLNRQRTAELLGFEGVARNSLDVSSDRDFLIEFVGNLAQIAVHLSSWAEEWILWCTTEFNLLQLRDAYTTGSSIMPQKRNPDVLELIRGKSARVIADCQQLFVLAKGLPLAYNRDLQEDKLPVFDAYDTVVACLELCAAIVETAELKRESISARLEEGFLDATSLMEYLIRRGVPMRSGHETVGSLVALCEQQGCRLADLSLSQLQQACDCIEDDVYQILGSQNAVRAFVTEGSAGPAQVEQQLAFWTRKLKNEDL
ncbi:MAG: argininosuccinate lyase [Planctomycetaceae bacterium]|nr:argininosuccinate lyase [Planctomycetaceae bacterium]